MITPHLKPRKQLKQLVLASSNPGKLREFESLLAALDIELSTQSALGIAAADEPHCTFIENALAKARHVSRLSNQPALADDSGLCVDALGGAPGVHSARFAAEQKSDLSNTSDAANNMKLIDCLYGQVDRRAHYYCVIVLMRHHDDPEPLIAEARWDGEIIDTPRGAGGFGYDPYLFLAGAGADRCRAGART